MIDFITREFGLEAVDQVQSELTYNGKVGKHRKLL